MSSAPRPGAPPLRRVLFRYPSDDRLRFVELFGEPCDWYHGQTLEPGPPGWRELELELPAGSYAYKLRRDDGSWLLDPGNPRTCGWEGVRNSLLVVGGCPEPLLHAPALPFVFGLDDGRVLLRAGLRRGAGERLGLRYREEPQAPWRSLALRPVAQEDEHLLFEGELPGATASCEYLFELPDGRVLGQGAGPTQALRVEPGLLRRRPPAWWRDAVLYTVFVDRFRKGGQGGAWSRQALALRTGARAGGDLAGVQEALPYLADLGVTALHLTPIVLAPSAHRYDTVDPLRVDPALGGEAALDRLVEAAQRASLRLIFDLGLSHVHRDFAPFREVRERGERSPYWDWFHIQRFPFREGPDPGYAHYRQENWDEPLLRCEHEEVADALVDSVLHWARRGVDGFRIDAAADLPLALVERLGEELRVLRPEAAVFAELLPGNLLRWTRRACDAATDFGSHHLFRDWLLRRQRGARDAAAALARRRFWLGGPPHSALAFTDTHDLPRLATELAEPLGPRLGLLFVLCGARVPALLYGEELGLRSEEPPRDFEDVWPDRRCMPWGATAGDRETHALVQAALRLRREHAVLRQGDEEIFALAALPPHEATDDLLVLRRRLGGEVWDLVLNRALEERHAALPEGAPSAAELLLGSGVVSLEAAGLRLGPRAGALLRRRLPAAAAETLEFLQDAGPQLAAEAWRSGSLVTPNLPLRLQLVVTERCNLRCRHCINLAPARSAAGHAGRMRPWLLDVLEPAFAAASHFALTGGGEALTEPLLWPLLERIRAQRAGRPGRYELLLYSNGMLLDPARLERLLDLGLSCLGVSLDGASAQSNEAARVGIDFRRVCAHIAGAVARRETGADLRVGVSCTVLQGNLDELGDLGRLAVDLGLDWLKVEEPFPASPFARRQWVAPDEARLHAGLDALRAALAGSRVRLVEHLAPPMGCPCSAPHNPDLAAFLAADDFANRVALHSCRAAWEQAFVEADGRLRALDAHHPVAGSLLHEPLLELWNGPVMQAVRRKALRRVPELQRRACPLPPPR